MKRKLVDALYVTVLIVLFFLPWLDRAFLPFGHDTLFHCGRIAMLAESMKHGNFLPAIYPDANLNYGYGTPSFYSDFFNWIPSLFNAMGMPLAACFKMEVIVITWLSVWNMMALMREIRDARACTWLAGAAYLFANYHITDIYVRGALGEITALAFLPLLLKELIRILYKKENCWMALGGALGLLLLSHNLTFLMGIALMVMLCLTRLQAMDRRMFCTLMKGSLLGFFLTAFFSLPMLEQLHAQPLNVSYYDEMYDLSLQSMTLRQYFSNVTSYGLAGNTVDQPMVENIGLFLTFAPLLSVPALRKENNSFIRFCLITGYVFWLLPSDLLPWNQMRFLGFLQFPWRLNTTAMVLLCVPAAWGISVISEKKKWICALILIALTSEGMWHTASNRERTWGMSDDITWQDVRRQNGITTYAPDRFSYQYEEVQGGEYLPVGSPDFRKRGDTVTSGKTICHNVTMQRTYGELTVRVSDNEKEELTAPLTWYKGYRIVKVNEDGSETDVPVLRSSDGLVSFVSQGTGTYRITYHSTKLRILCLWISGFAVLVTVVMCLKKRIFQSAS